LDNLRRKQGKLQNQLQCADELIYKVSGSHKHILQLFEKHFTFKEISTIIGVIIEIQKNKLCDGKTVVDFIANQM